MVLWVYGKSAAINGIDPNPNPRIKDSGARRPAVGAAIASTRAPAAGWKGVSSMAPTGAEHPVAASAAALFDIMAGGYPQT